MRGLTSATFATCSCARVIWSISRAAAAPLWYSNNTQFAIRNPRGFAHYDECCGGITASDGPGPTTHTVDGVERVFYDHIARGAPLGPDDGTLAPSAVVASLPFAPEIVLPTVLNHGRMNREAARAYGCKASFNPTFPARPKHGHGSVSPYNFGLNQGPIVLTIENCHSAFLWSLCGNARIWLQACGGQDLPAVGWNDLPARALIRSHARLRPPATARLQKPSCNSPRATAIAGHTGPLVAVPLPS